MPELPARPCLHAGCPEYAVRDGRCEAHTPEVDRFRGTTAERGYARGWPALRAMKLRRSPICEIRTLCQGARATEVDHIIPISVRPDLRMVWKNLQSACKPCNAAKGGRYPG